jgi:hypothetical protein
MRNILPVLFLLLLTGLAWGETAESFIPRVDAFDAAVRSASQFDDLYPILSANSVKELQTWTAPQREKAFQLLQMVVEMGPDAPMSVKESKIGDEQAAITLELVEKDGNSTMSVSREAEFRKEDGEWKTDLGAQLSKMKDYATK